MRNERYVGKGERKGRGVQVGWEAGAMGRKKNEGDKEYCGRRNFSVCVG